MLTQDPFLGAVPEADQVLEAVAAGVPETLARFSYDVRANRWWWSDEMFALHGMEPGETVPTTELLLAHKHPEDRLRTEGTLSGALATGEPFCCRHRIVDADGGVRHVLSIGVGVFDADRRIVAVNGYFVDLTDFVDHPQPYGGLTVLEPTSFDPVVEHAKGVLVAAYRLSPDAALELLWWAARQRAVPLPTLARALVDDFMLAPTNEVSAAARADRLLGLLPGSVD
ncbi:PAS and ANTAR domain-containing protein [Phycicoccus ginsengisoli]